MVKAGDAAEAGEKKGRTEVRPFSRNVRFELLAVTAQAKRGADESGAEQQHAGRLRNLIARIRRTRGAAPARIRGAGIGRPACDLEVLRDSGLAVGRTTPPADEED